jgi:hypothetical protein
MKMPVPSWLNGPLLATALVVSGCASVKTLSDSDTDGMMRLRRPAEIQVLPFATDDGMWQRGAGEPERRADIQDGLTGCLLRELSKVAPSYLLEGEPTSRRGWLVTGRFLRVNPGSRTGRLFLGGVGVGASRVETHVRVYDLAVSSTDPLFSFTTTGGSNLAAGIPGAMNELDDDLDRTAREIREKLERHLWPEGSPEGRAEVPPALRAVPVGGSRRP